MPFSAVMCASRQRKNKCRSLFWLCLRSNFPTVPADDSLHGCQAHAGPGKFATVVEPLECPKQAGRVFHVETRPVVPDKISRAPIVQLISDFDLRLIVPGSKFPGISQKIL